MSADPPMLVDGNVVYDAIMGDIEPDLLTSEQPLLEERYANETPQEHETRMLRYRMARARFDAEFAQRASVWDAAANAQVIAL